MVLKQKNGLEGLKMRADYPKINTLDSILDSGNRREFESGAVRDMARVS